MADALSFVVEESQTGQRLDLFLTAHLEKYSRSRIQRWIESGHVTVNGHAEKARTVVRSSDRVAVTVPEFAALPDASSAEIEILFEDKDLLVVNKPAGVVVHPAGRNERDTLVQLLWPHLGKRWAGLLDENGSVRGSSNPETNRPGVVHRLDKGTSGVIVLAKSPESATALCDQFASRSVKKEYRALVWGELSFKKGSIESPVGRSFQDPKRMDVSTGRWSATDIQVLDVFDRGEAGVFSYLDVRPRTGRTHQIRVHLSALGHPVVGDDVYGKKAGEFITPVERPMLHAYRLSFLHPRTRKPCSFTAEIPRDLGAILKSLRARRSPR
ncbi:MAG TPA: RluA family pseudouridine synthase [Elusimicrobiota bacterium]|nr:RluA family pseudouridine synthase [Elusimicrobiota bacterium]